MHTWTDVAPDVRSDAGNIVPRHSGVVLTPVLSHPVGLGLLDSCRLALRYRLSPAGDLAGCAPHARQGARNLRGNHKRINLHQKKICFNLECRFTVVKRQTSIVGVILAVTLLSLSLLPYPPAKLFLLLIFTTTIMA